MDIINAQNQNVFKKARRVGFGLGALTFVSYAVYLFYQIFSSDSSTALFGIIGLIYPGALYAFIGYIFGWSIALLLILPRTQNVKRKRFWQACSIAALFVSAWFFYATFLKAPASYFEGSLGVFPDGRNVAFVYGAPGNFDLYVTEVGTGKAKRLVDVPIASDVKSASPTNLSFTTDGKGLLFINNRNTDLKKFEARHGIKNGYLYRINIDSGEVMRIGEVMLSEAVESSSDQAFYGLISTRNSYKLIKLIENGSVVVTLWEAGGTAHDIKISPDEQTLFYTESHSFFRDNKYSEDHTLVKYNPNATTGDVFERTKLATNRAQLSLEQSAAIKEKIYVRTVRQSPFGNGHFVIGGALGETRSDTLFFVDSFGKIEKINLEFSE